MQKKGRYIAVFLIFTVIVIFGFFKINVCLPKSIRNKLNFKISYSLKPFDFTMETKNYMFYINKEAVNDAKDKINEAVNFMIKKVSDDNIPLSKVYDDLYNELFKCVGFTDYILRNLEEKAENVFKNLKPN